MGGNAFPRLELRRIKREEIAPTLRYLVGKLKYKDLTYDYVMTHLMGSTGKQSDSGDIDIALEEERNERPFEAKLQIVFPRGALKDIANRTEHKLGKEYVCRNGIKGGQLQTAWPIEGDFNNGLIQVDFIIGDVKWLTFSHWSPGLDVSPFKGVWISTLYGLMAKMHKDFEYNNPTTGERVARVGLRFDLERGLYRQWELQKREGMGASKVTPDYWETHFSRKLQSFGDTETEVPRFARLGFVTDPEAVLEILFNRPTKHEDVNTFEKAWEAAKQTFPDRIEEMQDRLVEALLRSGAKYTHTKEEMVQLIDELG